MSGQLWALLAGVGFGVFQASNRRAVVDLDVYVSTFLQLVVSALVLVGITLAAGHLVLLRSTSLPGVANFALAGLFHFFIGWTLLNASQKRIGAARTSPLIGTVPLFATVLAALALREVPHVWALLGVVLVVAGVYLVAREQGNGPAEGSLGARRPAPGDVGWRGALPGLAAALCWSVSPIFIRRGLVDLPSPSLGLAIGLVTSVAAYGVGMLFRRSPRGGPISRDAALFKLIAGTLVGLSQWARTVALALAPVGVVLAVTMVSTPVAMLLSPVLVGRHLERVTVRVWLGAGVIGGGSLLLILVR